MQGCDEHAQYIIRILGKLSSLLSDRLMKRKVIGKKMQKRKFGFQFMTMAIFKMVKETLKIVTTC